jgi:microbial collagenase
VAPGQTRYFYLWVPQGVESFRIDSKHGTGDASLYYNSNYSGTFADENRYQQASTYGGNWETIIVNQPASGYHYITVTGDDSGMSLSLSATYY